MNTVADIDTNLPPDIEVPVWIKRGGMIVNRFALNHDDKDHPYNYIVSLGYKPEDYGMTHPLYDEYEGKTRSELIFEIDNLKREITSIYKNEAAGLLDFKKY
jgi:hypothetical protein